MGTGTHFSTVSGTLRGWGTAKIMGIFGGESPKNLKIRGGDGGKILRDFAHSS